MFGTVRCANCGAVYGRDSIAVVGDRDAYWFIRCACETCGAQGLGVVIVKSVADGPPRCRNLASVEGVDHLRIDDVLEAHDLLRGYVGDARGLCERVSGP